jgi:hypothetical protein
VRKLLARLAGPRRGRLRCDVLVTTGLSSTSTNLVGQMRNKIRYGPAGQPNLLFHLTLVGAARVRRAATEALAACQFCLVLAPSSFAWLIRLSKAALMLESTGYRPQ